MSRAAEAASAEHQHHSYTDVVCFSKCYALVRNPQNKNGKFFCPVWHALANKINRDILRTVWSIDDFSVVEKQAIVNTALFISFGVWLSELIKNSLDARATEIAVRLIVRKDANNIPLWLTAGVRDNGTASIPNDIVNTPYDWRRALHRPSPKFGKAGQLGGKNLALTRFAHLLAKYDGLIYLAKKEGSVGAIVWLQSSLAPCSPPDRDAIASGYLVDLPKEFALIDGQRLENAMRAYKANAQNRKRALEEHYLKTRPAVERTMLEKKLISESLKNHSLKILAVAEHHALERKTALEKIKLNDSSAEVLKLIEYMLSIEAEQAEYKQENEVYHPLETKLMLIETLAQERNNRISNKLSEVVGDNEADVPSEIKIIFDMEKRHKKEIRALFSERQVFARKMQAKSPRDLHTENRNSAFFMRRNETPIAKPHRELSADSQQPVMQQSNGLG